LAQAGVEQLHKRVSLSCESSCLQDPAVHAYQAIPTPKSGHAFHCGQCLDLVIALVIINNLFLTTPAAPTPPLHLFVCAWSQLACRRLQEVLAQFVTLGWCSLGSCHQWHDRLIMICDSTRQVWSRVPQGSAERDA